MVLLCSSCPVWRSGRCLDTIKLCWDGHHCALMAVLVWTPLLTLERTRIFAKGMALVSATHRSIRWTQGAHVNDTRGHRGHEIPHATVPCKSPLRTIPCVTFVHSSQLWQCCVRCPCRPTPRPLPRGYGSRFHRKPYSACLTFLVHTCHKHIMSGAY